MQKSYFKTFKDKSSEPAESQYFKYQLKNQRQMQN